MLWIVALACGDCAVNASVNETSASVIRTSRTSPSATMSCCASGSRIARSAWSTAASDTIR